MDVLKFNRALWAVIGLVLISALAPICLYCLAAHDAEVAAKKGAASFGKLHYLSWCIDSDNLIAINFYADDLIGGKIDARYLGISWQLRPWRSTFCLFTDERPGLKQTEKGSLE